jgi:hypothetical protein
MTFLVYYGLKKTLNGCAECHQSVKYHLVVIESLHVAKSRTATENFLVIERATAIALQKSKLKTLKSSKIKEKGEKKYSKVRLLFFCFCFVKKIGRKTVPIIRIFAN